MKAANGAKLFYEKTGAGKGQRGEIKCHRLADNVYVTSWWDKKGVNMLHSFATYRDEAHRHERNKVTGELQELMIMRPTIIGLFNAGMGGTDRFDQYISYYRTSVKTKRWPHTIYFHFLLCCAVNAWIIMKLIANPTKHQVHGTLLSFQLDLIKSMCAYKSPTTAAAAAAPPAAAAAPVDTDGSESDDTDESDSDCEFLDPKDVRMHSAAAPKDDDKRFVGRHHAYSLPSEQLYRKKVIYNRKVCKMPNCGRKVSTYCRQCGVALCIQVDSANGEKSCFELYHKI